MKTFFILILLMALPASLQAQGGAERNSALDEFDSEVDGARQLVNTVPPLSKGQIRSRTEPLWYDYDDFYPWPYDYPEDELFWGD
ncbi:MAG: hypothetical protein HQ594_04750 [Candidatus Omnitrophica bacterium]|nr:hypothetical protein [Candidatus Omnitrophota bacterium]